MTLTVIAGVVVIRKRRNPIPSRIGTTETKMTTAIGNGIRMTMRKARGVMMTESVGTASETVGPTLLAESGPTEETELDLEPDGRDHVLDPDEMSDGEADPLGPVIGLVRESAPTEIEGTERGGIAAGLVPAPIVAKGAGPFALGVPCAQPDEIAAGRTRHAGTRSAGFGAAHAIEETRTVNGVALDLDIHVANLPDELGAPLQFDVTAPEIEIGTALAIVIEGLAPLSVRRWLLL